MRGRYSIFDLKLHPDGFIPAYAGQIMSVGVAVVLIQVHPRVCGADIVQFAPVVMS